MGSRQRARGLLLVGFLALGSGGCRAATLPASLRTAPVQQQTCDLALLAGSLERHPQTGLGIGLSDVQVTPVEWPFGYSARVEGTSMLLLDEKGTVVAREHDRVQVGGGMGGAVGANEVWFACGGVSVVSNEGG